MTFTVPADAYDRFMGRYSTQLSSGFCDVAGVRPGQRVLDVGCGPGALTGELVRRLGAGAVAAVDPSDPFVAAARERFPDVDVQQATAEQLPYADDTFDAALAQLVVHFMTDPAAGVAEMRRVTRPGGVVAACVWDHGTGHGPLSPLWAAVHDLDPGAGNESSLMGSNPGDLLALLEGAGLGDVEESVLPAEVEYATFEDWWEPMTHGVGPSGQYIAKLDDASRDRLVARARERLGDGPVVVAARAWTARGVA
jgi:SAM-dependent methyltransferase